MTKLELQNYFSTQLLSPVSDSDVGEIEIELAVEPQSEFGYLIVDYVDEILREEIFYHRKAGTSVFTYGVNRTNPQAHDVAASVQLNDSASLFNYLSQLTSDQGFMYKTSDATMSVRGGWLFDNGSLYQVPDKEDLVFTSGTNYLYIDDEEIKTTQDTLTDKYVFGEVVMNGSGEITGFEHYNTLSMQTQRPNIILRGDHDPDGGEGIDGDYYINDDSKLMFGPKDGGAWPAGFSIQGEQGEAATIAVGTVTGGDAGTDPEVTNAGDENDAVFDFIIPKGESGNIAEAPDETEQTICDNILKNDTAVVTNPVANSVQITETDGSYTVYTTLGYGSKDSEGETISVTQEAATVDGDYLVYADFRIHTTTGTIRACQQTAYRKMDNIFTKENTFDGNTIFGGQVSFRYHRMTQDSESYNANDGNKQAVTYITTGAKVMDFTNLRPGGTYILALSIQQAGTSIDWGTPNGKIINASKEIVDGTYDKNKLDDTAYPLTLSVATHIFIIECFSTGIYFSYAGESTSLPA